MHRIGSRVGRFLGVLALTGTAVFAAMTVAAPPAFADGASNCSTNFYLCTIVQYGGTNASQQPRDPSGEGGTESSGGYISSCWLQPQTAWGNQNVVASSPAGLEQYLIDMAAIGDHIGGFQAWFQPMWQLYNAGKGADPGIGLSAPPFNTGVSGGQWYGIACVPSANNYQDYVAIQVAMGVKGINLTNDYENWFWLQNGQPTPAGVTVMTPSLLGRYAANHISFNPEFPQLSPTVGTVQTVNLPVTTADNQSGRGYAEFLTWARIPGMFSEVKTYPVSVTYTASPQGLITPSSVTCYFKEDGTLKSACPTFQFTEPERSGATITATSMWDVTWIVQDGEAPWTEQLPGPPVVVNAPLTVQEIQTIN